MARSVSFVLDGVGLAHRGRRPGGGVSSPLVVNPCAVLELKYNRTFAGIGIDWPAASTTLSDARSCQNSVAESIWKTSGSVAGRFRIPSRMPLIGSRVTP